jgi:hypothetical protein
MSPKRSRRFRDERARIRANTQPCVFCGADDATSPEDVIPSWLSRIAPDDVTLIHSPPFLWTHGQLGPISSDGKNALPIHDDHEFLVLAAICEDCNGGWLSRLENAVSAVLKPMILGQTQSLTAQQQEWVTFWALKTALLLDHTCRPGFRLMPPQLFGLLFAERTTKKPPPMTEASLGYVPFATFAVDLGYTSNLEVVRGRVIPDDFAYRIVLIVGRLMFVVTGTNVDRPVWVPPQVRGDEALVQIHPGRGPVEWPPAIGWAESAAVAFSLALDAGYTSWEFRNTSTGRRPILRVAVHGDMRAAFLKLRTGEFPTFR